jgi:septum site-determining protein MinD
MILAVTAGKGGVGKSTVAYNLAAELDGVVIDADLGMADLPASRGPDLHDVLAGRADPIEAVHEDGPVALLPCGRSLGGFRAADPAALVESVRAVRRHYGRVIIDSPAGLASDAGLPVLAADACLLVVRPTRAAIADGVRTRELARAIGTPLVQIVLNRAAAPSEDDARTDRIASTLGAPVTTVPDNDVIARAQRAGRPVRSIAPDSQAVDQFVTLAASVESALGRAGSSDGR